MSDKARVPLLACPAVLQSALPEGEDSFAGHRASLPPQLTANKLAVPPSFATEVACER